MGQQISSYDGARTQVVAEDTPTQHSCSVSLESVTPQRTTPDNIAPSQMQTADNPPAQPPSKQSEAFRQDIKQLTAPLRANLVLQNKGNVARDHLASERTYLAYVRTSLACASAGVGESVALFMCQIPIAYDLNVQLSYNRLPFPVPQTQMS